MNPAFSSILGVFSCATLCLLPTLTVSGGTPEELVDWDYAMATDRPDTTESPFSVKYSHWQFELETVSVSLDGHSQTEDWGSVNLKYGLSRHTDIQLVTPAWHTGHGEDGWSDTELRFKWNLTGREKLDGADADRPFAIALMPYIKLPTADDDIGNGNVEGGLIIPFAFQNTPLACMVQADVIRNEDDDGYTGAFTFSATYGFELSKRLSAFTELVTILPLEGSAETYANAGLVYAIRRLWFVDAGINVGLNDDATDLRFFTGMSRRF